MQAPVLIALAFSYNHHQINNKSNKKQMKNPNKILSIILLILSVVIFSVYVWFAVNYNHIEGGWAGGIWLVSIGVFVTSIALWVAPKK